MKSLFPEPITNLPEADIPIDGIAAYLSQADSHQILFMEFEKDVDLPEHGHAAQMGIVLEGRIELVIDGEKRSFSKGDRYYIPKGVRHSGKIYAGYYGARHVDWWCSFDSHECMVLGSGFHDICEKALISP